MNERIKQIRVANKLSQVEFGARLGVSNTAISKLESGENNVTEQMSKLICREFNVSYAWLKNGIGEMVEEKEENSEILAMLQNVLAGENETARILFLAFAKLDERDWQAVQKMIDNLKK